MPLQFALLIDLMRIKDLFNENYFFEFSRVNKKYLKEYPNIFIDPDAPNDFIISYYKNSISLDYILRFPTFFQYFEKLDLSNVFYDFNVYVEIQENGVRKEKNFLKET